METVKNFFDKIINNNVFQLLLLILFVLFAFSFIERLKMVKFDPILFLGIIICILFAYILGQSLKDSSSLKEKIKEKEEKDRFIIGEKLYVLRNKNLSEKEREEAFWELMELDFLTHKDFQQIFDYIDETFPFEGSAKQKLIDSVIEKIQQIKQKARDT